MRKYNIIGKTATYRATFKAGKLMRLEHVRGKNTSDAWSYLMRSIPHNEEHLHNAADLFPNLKVEAVKSEAKTMYKYYVSDWFHFYHNLNGVEPKFSGTDGKALKSIITYLEGVSPNPETARATWQTILHRWHLLPEFHRAKTDIVYINAKLNEIITLLNTQNVDRKAQSIRDKI